MPSHPCRDRDLDYAVTRDYYRNPATTRFFKIEALDLRFSNGVERRYERLPAGGAEGVIVVAVNAQNELLLIREYAAGFHEMQLTLPKGLLNLKKA